MSRKIGLRSLKNLCAFIGAVALFSYFYNFFVDLRHWHWYVTLTSAFVCLILWLGFYMVEVHKEAVTHFALTLTRVASGWVSGRSRRNCQTHKQRWNLEKNLAELIPQQREK